MSRIDSGIRSFSEKAKEFLESFRRVTAVLDKCEATLKSSGVNTEWWHTLGRDQIGFCRIKTDWRLVFWTEGKDPTPLIEAPPLSRIAAVDAMADFLTNYGRMLAEARVALLNRVDASNQAWPE